MILGHITNIVSFSLKNTIEPLLSPSPWLLAAATALPRCHSNHGANTVTYCTILGKAFWERSRKEGTQYDFEGYIQDVKLIQQPKQKLKPEVTDQCESEPPHHLAINTEDSDIKYLLKDLPCVLRHSYNIYNL